MSGATAAARIKPAVEFAPTLAAEHAELVAALERVLPHVGCLTDAYRTARALLTRIRNGQGDAA